MAARTCLAASVLMALCITSPAFGDWSEVTLETAAQIPLVSNGQSVNASSSPAQEEVLGSFGAEQQVDSFDLDANRGREGNTTLNQVNKMTLDAVMTNNVTENVVSGNNTITDGAFAGTTGFPMVIQNSGSNVIIQNATILNLNVK